MEMQELAGNNISLEVVVYGGASGISDETLHIFSWVVYGVVCQIINVFGMVTNIINIICFVKQGFHDSVNVSLVGLSISDLGCLSTLFLIGVCYTPAFSSTEFNFEPMEVNYLVAAIPHLTFARVTSWITAIITLERCLCVIAPLKIKMIFTPKRTFALIACVFILFFSSIAPVYVVNRLEMKFSHSRNKTIYGLIYTDDKENVEQITFAVSNFVLPFVAFIIIVVCTTTLVFKLKSATKWRLKSTDKSQSENVSHRNQVVARMVVMISGLFIACFIPISISMLALAFEPDLTINGKYFNVAIVIWGLGFILESVNSSMNIFIYYHMSSKYRDIFQKVFCTVKFKLLL